MFKQAKSKPPKSNPKPAPPTPSKSQEPTEQDQLPNPPPSPSPSPSPTATNPPPPEDSHPQPPDFESYYLQRLTAEFADDLDTVRRAGDFTADSIPVLVRALKQGAQGFSEEEKRKVMGALTRRPRSR